MLGLLGSLLQDNSLKQQGFWNASTNTPTLANGTGVQGYYYVVSTGGTVNFGAGNITFTVGDWVYYNTANQWVKFETGVDYVPVNQAGDTMTGNLVMSGAAINEAGFVTVASATTCNIGTAASNNVAISGTTTITSFGTANAGITRRCRATGAFLITYNGTSLITANGKNIVTKANDCFTMTSLGSGNWIMTNFKPADGRILANAVNNQTGTTYTLAITDLGNDVTLSNAAAVTTTLPLASTFPIGSKFKVTNKGAGTNTFVKVGGSGDTVRGNVTQITDATSFLEVISATEWEIFAGTSVVTECFNVAFSGVLVTNQVYDIAVPNFSGTITGLSLRNTSITTAGTYTAKIDGTNITGLAAIANSTTRTLTAATAANTFVSGQVISYTPTGITAVVNAFITLYYTRSY